jgi:hypothetical protein
MPQVLFLICIKVLPECFNALKQKRHEKNYPTYEDFRLRNLRFGFLKYIPRF